MVIDQIKSLGQRMSHGVVVRCLILTVCAHSCAKGSPPPLVSGLPPKWLVVMAAIVQARVWPIAAALTRHNWPNTIQRCERVPATVVPSPAHAAHSPLQYSVHPSARCPTWVLSPCTLCSSCALPRKSTVTLGLSHQH